MPVAGPAISRMSAISVLSHWKDRYEAYRRELQCRVVFQLGLGGLVAAADQFLGPGCGCLGLVHVLSPIFCSFTLQAAWSSVPCTQLQ